MTKILLATLASMIGLQATPALAENYEVNLTRKGSSVYKIDSKDIICWRRFKSEPPCRLNFEPGLQASLRGPAVDKCSA